MIRPQSGLPGLYLIFSPVPVATHPHQGSPLCCFDAGLFLALHNEERKHLMSNFLITANRVLYTYSKSVHETADIVVTVRFIKLLWNLYLAKLNLQIIDSLQ